MAKRKSKYFDKPFELDQAFAPWTRCPFLPTDFLKERVAEHIRQTGEPETCPDIYRGPLPNDIKYRIVRPIDIDRSKRPKLDKAPCPMCTSDKFLKGFLIWCQDLQITAIIGHCCAEYSTQADIEYRREQKFNQEESYLLKALPELPAKRAILSGMMPAAHAAKVLYRKFRAQMPEVQEHLRTVKDRSNAELVTYEELTDESEKPKIEYGPAGFKQGEAKVREHRFGRLEGTTALIRDYKPEGELNDAIRTADSFDFDGSEERALDAIVAMDDKLRAAAVNICKALDDRWAKFHRRISDFAQFWTPANLSRLNSYGTNPYTLFHFEAAHISPRNIPHVVIRRHRKELRMPIPGVLFDLDRPWKAFSLK